MGFKVRKPGFVAGTPLFLKKALAVGTHKTFTVLHLKIYIYHTKTYLYKKNCIAKNIHVLYTGLDKQNF